MLTEYEFKQVMQNLGYFRVL
jgi:hypothetical protein